MKTQYLWMWGLFYSTEELNSNTLELWNYLCDGADVGLDKKYSRAKSEFLDWQLGHED